jgi:2'-5' RNA ligase
MSTRGLIKRTERFNDLFDKVPEAYMRTLRMNEYLIVLALPEELRERIMNVKQAFAEKYDTNAARFLKPHLALAQFKTWDIQEEKLVTHLHSSAMGFPPFKVELKDFGSLPTHSIFINVTSKIPILSLVKELKTAQRLMKADPAQDPHFMNEPVITIGRKLLPWQYEKGWLEYSHKHFSGKFIAESMLLLKRPVDGKAWQIIERLAFENLPVGIKQGALFA